MSFTHALSTNNYGGSRIIVSSSSANGTHTTIASANAAASSGDTIVIRDGTYTEDVTMKAGVVYTTWSGYQNRTAVKVTGKWSFAGASNENTSLNNMYLENNGSHVFDVSGGNVWVNNCGGTFTSDAITQSSGLLTFRYCKFDTSGGSLKLFNVTGGSLVIEDSGFENSSSSSTASTISSSGFAAIRRSSFRQPITTSNTSILQLESVNVDMSAMNVKFLTHNSTGSNCFMSKCVISTGTATSGSIGSGASIGMSQNEFVSSNTSVLDGAGSITSGINFFTGSSYLVSTTSVTGRTFETGGISFDNGTNRLSSYAEGTWTPAISFSTPGTSSFGYSAQVGRYCKIGNVVYISARINLSSLTVGTGAGNVQITPLPYTVANVTNQSMSFSVWMQTVTYDASVSWYSVNPGINSTVATFLGNRSGTTVATMSATGGNLASTSQISTCGCYSTA